ncbi:MAG: acyl-CoA dehydrogenase family protein [Myxococcota bacterium]|nr:acyl-CoA dehydrogenase family protein [Myxococcota bacterium]
MRVELDEATRRRVEGIRMLGRAQVRPLGLEADRLGRPIPPDHEFFELLLKIGQGRTRWSGEQDPAAEPAARDESDRPELKATIGTSRALLAVAEELSYWDRGVAVSLPGPGLGEPPIIGMGTPDQKERFLRPFIDPGKPRWGSFAMTEPGAGSDVAAIRTVCRKDGDHWVLNGAKSFAANASRADWILVWATIDRNLGREGHRAFVIEQGTPGLGDFHVEKKMGLKAYESTSFTMRDCRVPADSLLGSDEHYARKAGFKGAMKSFNSTRPLVAAMAVGMGRAAFDEALAFAKEQDLLGDVRVRDRLERIRRRLRVARLLCWRAAWLADHSRPNIVEASMSKAVAPAVALEAASLGMELLGEVGARGEHLIEKLFRDVKAMDIVEGTGQIQRIVMARQLVQLPR